MLESMWRRYVPLNLLSLLSAIRLLFPAFSIYLNKKDTARPAHLKSLSFNCEYIQLDVLDVKMSLGNGSNNNARNALIPSSTTVASKDDLHARWSGWTACNNGVHRWQTSVGVFQPCLPLTTPDPSPLQPHAKVPAPPRRVRHDTGRIIP